NQGVVDLLLGLANDLTEGPIREQSEQRNAAETIGGLAQQGPARERPLEESAAMMHGGGRRGHGLGLSHDQLINTNSFTFHITWQRSAQTRASVAAAAGLAP